MALLPTWLSAPLSARRRSVLYVERSAQRRFLADYRGQMERYEPIIRARGRVVGRVLLDAILHRPDHGRQFSYGEAISASLSPSGEVDWGEGRGTGGTGSAASDLAAGADRLLSPILGPFVE